ncbi:MAG TPA: aldo/keto reductase [Nitrospirales bacterium]|nr:aldo/keto reductase [Nitrospirales bacterium]
MEGMCLEHKTENNQQLQELTLPGAGDKVFFMPKLPQRILGKTGVSVPILGFGTAPIGNRRNAKDAAAIFHEAINLGVTYIDTAPDFAGYGRAQEYLGPVLKERRHEVFLVTKCFEPNGEKALRLLERNLKELQTDHTDLVFVHSLGHDTMDPSQVFSRRGVYPALLQAKAQGLARFVGVSGHNRPHRFVKAIQQYEWDVLMNATNFVDRHTYNFEEQVLPIAAKKKIGLVAMKVFGGQERSFFAGLSNRNVPTPYLDIAFRYALSLPQVACSIIGMSTSEELHQNVARAQNFTPITPRELMRIAPIGQTLAKKWGAHFGALA